MKKEGLEGLFEKLQEDFDFATPVDGHEARFMEKLDRFNGTVQMPRKQERNWWKPLSIAASVALLFTLGTQFYPTGPSVKEQVVQIAPEASKTELYFASLIEEQVQLLQQEKTPETEKLINDTLARLQDLETDYQKLEHDLIAGGNSKLLLNAMITNFQIRIALLEEVLANIETIKNLKPQNDDTNFTI